MSAPPPPFKGRPSKGRPFKPRDRTGDGGKPFHTDRGARAGSRSDRAPEDGPPVIFGFHAVEAALANPRRVIRRALFTENAENRLKGPLEARDLAVERVTPRDLDRRLGADTVHQGALIEVEDLPEPAFKVLAREARGRPLIVLDQVTDPHNVGAILRSAAVFGAAGLVMTRRHSPPLAGVLAKAASGALELVPVIRVQNLARTLDDLKAAGFTIVGLEGTATEQLEEMAWPETVALVLGAEGKGLRELTGTTCDRLVKVATDGPIASLNVSNAAAIALHTAAMSRRGWLKPPGR